jgi:DNA-binding PadR family transcriptional regulator
MYICYQNENEMKNSIIQGSLNTIIMKLLEENGKMYGYEITQK